MRAVKLTGTITSNHKLMIDLPDDLPTGPAEIIVLVDDASAVPTGAEDRFEAFLESLETSPHRQRSKAEIDRYLEEDKEQLGRALKRIYPDSRIRLKPVRDVGASLHRYAGKHIPHAQARDQAWTDAVEEKHPRR